jgi:hypothetical protein
VFLWRQDVRIALLLRLFAEGTQVLLTYYWTFAKRQVNAN